MKNLHNPIHPSLSNQNMAFVGERSRGTHYNRNYNQTGQPSGFTLNGRGFIQSSNPHNLRGPFSGQSNSTGSLKHSSELGPTKTPKEEKEEVRYQICDKLRHTALECWHRFNQVYQPNNITQALVATSLHI